MKILVLLSRVPYPTEKGDKLRAFNQIKQLSKHHEIILFALNDMPLHKEAIDTLKPYCSEIKISNLSKFTILLNLIKSLFNGNPFQVGYFYTIRAQKEVNALIKKHKPDHIYCQLIRTAEYVKEHTDIPKTLDYMDVFSKGMERRSYTAPFYLKPIFRLEHKRLLHYEHAIFDYFQNKVIISEQDKNLIPHPKNSEISVISNGVDTDYFKPLERKKEFELLFNGNMSYPPNVESVEYLVKNILPLVLKKYPDVRLLISGTSPSQKVYALRSRYVFVSGWTKDIRDNFSKSKILVAPMQISIGLQNKLLEAMAMNIPCITSSLANNALGAENGRSILVADKPEEYAQHIIMLLENENEVKEIATNASDFVLQNYNWESTTKKLEMLLSNVKK